MGSPRGRWRLLGLAIGLALAPMAGATVDPPTLPQDSSPTAPPREALPKPAAPTPHAPPPAGDAPTAAAPAPAVPPAQPASGPHAPVPAPAVEDDLLECSLALEAAPFLREASSRGIQPRAVGAVACDMSPADNRFFGPGGDAPCRLQFDNARWLKPGMRFAAMTGVGTFDARTTGSGVDVTIPADGGVRFQRVAVRLAVRRPATCPAPQARNVLAE